MPNRILRESICTSDNLDRLTPQQEVLFYRIIVNSDDYGRMEASTKILRARCFPLKIDAISDEEIASCLQALADNDLLTVYEVYGRQYSQLTTWERHHQDGNPGERGIVRNQAVNTSQH